MMCYHAKFRCSSSKRTGISTGVPKMWGMLGPARLYRGMADPSKHAPPPSATMPNLVILGQTVQVYIQRSTRNSPLHPAFQGHS